MQIDWISAITATHPELWPGYTTGERFKVSPAGEILDRRPSLHQVDDDDPSSSRNFTVWTPSPGTLYLSGNPVKLLQGHNLWGSTDAYPLFFEAGAFIRQHAGLFPGPETWRSCEFSLPRFTRIDLTRSYRFPSLAEADDYIRFIAANSRSRHGAATLVGGTTVYYGQHSRRWSFKVYSKFHEMVHAIKKRNRLVTLLQRAPASEADLTLWSSGVVRFELTLRTPELETVPLSYFSNPAALAHLWSAYYSRITLSDNTAMNTQSPLLEQTLPPLLQGVLALWKQGQDLRRVYPQRTFYRHRRDILNALGIDISIPPAPQVASIVRPDLDPAGWDPEPIAAYTKEPRQDLLDLYGIPDQIKAKTAFPFLDAMVAKLQQA